MARTDDGNVFKDLSGIQASSFGNPYDGLLEACANDPKQIQLRYQTHRETRNEQQKAKLLSAEFPGFMIDPILEKLINPAQNPGYVDPRNCLVFWARPPKRIRALVDSLQKRLLEVAPSLWLMPPDCLHMTALEITHSKKEAEIEQLVKVMEGKIPEITDFTCHHHARLVKPMLSYDAAAIALSFVPAAGEGSPGEGSPHIDTFTYHHLRRDLYDLCSKTGVEIASRYTVPSSHLTIARFVTQKDIAKPSAGALDNVPDPEKICKLVEVLDDINRDLRTELWSEESSKDCGTSDGIWTVGDEKGLECRKGTLWYGGGQRLHLGRGYTLP